MPASLPYLADWFLVWCIPIFIGMIGLEVWILTRPAYAGRAKGFDVKDSAASLSMGLGFLFIATAVKFGVVALHYWLYQFRLFDLAPSIWWTWPLLFFAEDLCYYCYHRAGHRVRFVWAAHVNHHSSEHYNFTTALRQSYTSPMVSFIFWLPLPLIGFHPLAILLMQAISLLYQFFLHTEAVDRLGFLEKFLNTPSHHRVHHGSNGKYIDRNYAGWLIVWDKLFRSFEPEDPQVPVRYGLVHNIHTFNPIKIAFHEWQFLLGKARKAARARDAFGWTFGPPEWTPHGPSLPPDHPAFKAASPASSGPGA